MNNERTNEAMLKCIADLKDIIGRVPGEDWEQARYQLFVLFSGVASEACGSPVLIEWMRSKTVVDQITPDGAIKRLTLDPAPATAH